MKSSFLFCCESNQNFRVIKHEKSLAIQILPQQKICGSEIYDSHKNIAFDFLIMSIAYFTSNNALQVLHECFITRRMMFT